VENNKDLHTVHYLIDRVGNIIKADPSFSASAFQSLTGSGAIMEYFGVTAPFLVFYRDSANSTLLNWEFFFYNDPINFNISTRRTLIDFKGNYGNTSAVTTFEILIVGE
jgi:hypothetical protein